MVELLVALGNVGSGGTVGLSNYFQIRKVGAELLIKFVFLTPGIVHSLRELCGNGQGLGDNIKLKLFHGILPFLSV